MTSRDFCFWLQGFMELRGPGDITAAQADIVQRHLAMVFKHEIDPSMGGSGEQAKLDAIHQGVGTLPGWRLPAQAGDGTGPKMRC